MTLSEGTSIQFNLLNPNGTLNSQQYGAYEHVLIHDDLASTDGDPLSASLADAMGIATSVTVPGQPPQKIDSTTAAKIIKERNLMTATITNRKAKRPPAVPSRTGGCTNTGGKVGPVQSHNRATRDVTENVGGFVVQWNGVIPNY